ncbi:PAS domain S-box protein [Sulfitobacter sp. S190]|uniref:PAS domain S-box protein n=1 Tax=Sulfitobacter sp. S190 TaxID=2867022 RepID=UPI0021A477E2|nr:PAS domain S-box protein [Sulfitobacter sp. S190]UWR21936.1 PAS domain S-box protein [Sulfitobacter sp. S190]
MSRKLGYLLVFVCLLMSFGLFNFAREYTFLRADYEFRRITDDSIEAVENRINSYTQVLTGVAAYLGVEGNVSRQEFEEYIASLSLPIRYSGMLGIGFIEEIGRDQSSMLEARLGWEYGRDIAIHPQSDAATQFVVVRMAPTEGNETVIGLDTGFEEGRRHALETSRAIRGSILTPRLLLVQDETQQAGFLLTQPVFTRNPDAVDPVIDGDEFRGWVVAPFIGPKVLSKLTGAEGTSYEVAIYDAQGPSPDALIHYSSDDGASIVGSTAPTGTFTSTYQLNLHGRTWHIAYASTPGFDKAFSSYLPHLALLLGLTFSALLALALKYISLRSRALAEVAENRARLLDAQEDENRALLENAVSAILILDSTGRIIFSNQAAAAVFKAPVGSMIGKGFDDYVSLKPGKKDFDRHNAEGICAEGRRLLLDVETNSWSTADGAERITAIIRDVTEQIRAEREIQEMRRRYDLALDGAEIGVFDIDLTTGKSVVSDTWHKIMGTSDVAEVFDHQRHFMERVHPDDLAELLEADRKCIAGEERRSCAEYRIRFGDTWRWMYSDAVAVERSKSGKALRLVGTQADVTELRHSRNALQVSEERFRMVLREAPVGMALMDEHGHFTGVNDALVRLCGYSEETLQDGMRLGDLMHPDDLDAMTKDVRNLIAHNGAKTHAGQYRFIRRNGEECWGLVSVTWTRDENLDSNVFIAQIVDITDQKKLEQIKSEFVATVSHELRTPLTSIKGALGLLGASSGDGMPEAATRLLEIARVNADRLTVIVNDILDLEKISSGEVVFQYENVSLNDVVQASLNEMQPFAAEHKNTLDLTASDDDIVVKIDGSRTKQVLANLISNACKYSDPETAVSVRIERLGEDAIVFVQNIGPGIPESFQSKIFDAFTQADGSDTRSKGGTGLGLNITRQIVARQGGKIGFQSNPGGLTVFWFTCPLIEVDAVLPRDETPADQIANQSELRLMHLEDDKDFAEVIRAGFGPRVSIEHACSIAEAREMLRGDPFDVVLIDWSLLDGNAEVLVAQIKEHQPQAKIVTLSAQSNTKYSDDVCLAMIKSRVEIDAVVTNVWAALGLTPPARTTASRAGP